MKRKSLNYGRIIRCPLCQEKKYKILYPSTLEKKDLQRNIIKKHLKNSLDDYRKHAQIVRCLRCSVVYTNPMEDIKKLYRGYADVVDEEYLATEKYRKLILSEHLMVVEKYKKSGKMLDVGAFAGFFLELAKERGWETYGIEPSIWASKEAKKRGITIVGKTFETTVLKPNTYDAITMWDVIEHLPNPHFIVKKIHKVLKKGGIVALGTPNVNSLFAKVLGSHYPFYIRMHLILYSPKTLKKLLEHHGFEVIYTTTYGRIFPLSYILAKIDSKNALLKQLKKLILSQKTIADFPIHLNFRDSFTIVAKK